MMMSGNDRKLRVTSVSNPACGTQSVSSTCWIRNTPCIFANVSTTYDFHIERYSLYRAWFGHFQFAFDPRFIRACLSQALHGYSQTHVHRPTRGCPYVGYERLHQCLYVIGTYSILWNAVTSPETVLNGNSVETKYIRLPPTYVIVLASSVTTMEVKAIDFYKILIITIFFLRFLQAIHNEYMFRDV